MNRIDIIKQIKQESIQKRTEALKEAAKNAYLNTPIATSTGSSTIGRSSGPCNFESGVSLFTRDTDEETYSLYPLYFEGIDENGNPAYSLVIFEGLIRFDLYFDPESNFWILETDVFGRNENAVAPELFSTEWTNAKDLFFEINESVCGTEVRDTFGYHCTIIDNNGEVTTVETLPQWDDDDYSSYPTTWSWIGGNYRWNGSAWIFSGEGFDDIALPGGSAVQLPVGDFILGEGVTLTVTDGVCPFNQNDSE